MNMSVNQFLKLVATTGLEPVQCLVLQTSALPIELSGLIWGE